MESGNFPDNRLKLRYNLFMNRREPTSVGREEVSKFEYALSPISWLARPTSEGIVRAIELTSTIKYRRAHRQPFSVGIVPLKRFPTGGKGQ